METDIGEFTQQNTQPIPIDDDYGHQQHYGGGGPTASQFQYFSPMQPQQPQQHFDVFASLGKTAYIIIFVAFILGFFMGKTMQPVIIRG